MDIHPVIKKLQWKNSPKPALILNAPAEYKEIIEAFNGEVHTEETDKQYEFVQVFSTSNEELRQLALRGITRIEDDGLLWLCYPKKTSKKYKNSDCSRETVARLLADEGFEPVRQVAVDEDWSALRFRKAEKIKTLTRKKAYTSVGKQRIGE